MVEAYLGLGSNVGDRKSHLQWAIHELQAYDGVRVRAVSPIYESEAHVLPGSERQDAYLNGVVQIHTSLDPIALLDRCLRLEYIRGRRRSKEERWQPRLLDVDILSYGNLTRFDTMLQVPHPRIAERRFVLQPWWDVNPDYMVPTPLNKTVATLLKECKDLSAMQRVETLSLDT